MKKIIVWIVCLAPLLLIGVIYIGFNGAPWKLYAIQKDAAQYMQEQYGIEVVIMEANYAFKDGHYYVLAHPTGNEELVFRVNEYKNRNADGYHITDNYMRVFWTNKIESEFEPLVKSIFSERDGALVSFPGDYLYEQLKDEKNETDQQEKKTLVERSRLDIFIRRDFATSHADEEYQKVLDVVDFIQDEQYTFAQINVFFAQGEDTDSAEGKVRRTYFHIPLEKLQDIKTKEDIKAIQR